MHTPAPWHARVTDTINDKPAQWQIRDRHGVIATVDSVNHDDAALLAAAPALLAALELLLYQWQIQHHLKTNDRMALKQVIDAIAAAKGVKNAR